MRWANSSPSWLRSGGFILRTGLLIGLVVIFSAANPVFFSVGNAYALMQNIALLGLVTLGLAMTMIAGEFDLGVGSMLAVGGLVTITLSSTSMLAGFALSIAIGVVFGLANGFVVRWLKVSSLVVTVGTMMFLSGMAFEIAGGKVVTTDNFDPGFALDEPILKISFVSQLHYSGRVFDVRARDALHSYWPGHSRGRQPTKRRRSKWSQRGRGFARRVR